MTSARLLLGPNGGRFPFSNCILIENGSTVILVDTGCSHDTIARIRGKVTHVVLTHHHPDHISGYSLLQDKPTYSPIQEKPYVTLEDLGKRYATTHYREWMMMATTLMGVKVVPRASEYYRPGEDVCIRGTCIKTIPAPGHLLSHTLIEPDAKWLHITDIDLTGFGPWYANPEANPLQFLADIEKAYHYEAKCYTTSHKPDKYCGDEARERLRRYALRLVESLETIYNALPANDYTDEWNLTGKGLLYRRYLPGAEDIMRYFEAALIRKLLPILHTLGCAEPGLMGYRRRGECSSLSRLRDGILSRLS
ncbi:MAG: MBL fold metallo-hydrolase [Desulfurococcales archaeon]|nr:MBL fold metallo-hydrolase [Desulfurococcales archaeon]MCE4605087.1 MBL fold metallo-hydrolase [Desulfurococcales archaeon]